MQLYVYCYPLLQMINSKVLITVNMYLWWMY